MTLAKAKANTNETFIVQASLTIVFYDRQNIFIAQATGVYLQKVWKIILMRTGQKVTTDRTRS